MDICLSFHIKKEIALSNCLLCYSLSKNMVLLWVQLMMLPTSSESSPSVVDGTKQEKHRSVSWGLDKVPFVCIMLFFISIPEIYTDFVMTLTLLTGSFIPP